MGRDKEIVPGRIPESPEIKVANAEKSVKLFERRDIRWGKDAFESVLKFGAGLAAGMYLLGLLVANDYLSTLGVTDFSIIRVRYILTGLEVVFLPMSAALLLVLIITLTLYSMPISGNFLAKSWKLTVERAETICSILLPVLLIPEAYLLWKITGGPVGFIKFRYAGSHENFLRSYLALMLLLALSFLCASKVKLTLNPNPIVRAAILLQPRFKRIGLLILPLAGLVLIIWGVHLWAIHMFPKIPMQFGGGEPRQVRLVLMDQSRLQVARALGVPVDSDGFTAPVDLLWETETLLVVREVDKPDGEISLVDRDTILVVINIELEDYMLIPVEQPSAVPSKETEMKATPTVPVVPSP